ncbi:glycoside hydrolase family 28 protein [Mangrovibacterium sp.]|uniref:glycoside hydrolase family 28 protein n=1 Tax=Mangrovibacterium sp. TaxID=1961364 RepID=UPI003561A1A7
MKVRSFIKIFVLSSVVSTGYANQSSKKVPIQYAPENKLEFEMPDIQEPAIPDYTVSIKDFGAKSGGHILNTQAFADAISAVSSKGGGKVVIPPGIWLTGPIILKSNLELHAESGALIVFSTDKDLYPIIETSFEGLDTWRCISPIYGKNVENIAFTGMGIWDGSGDSWRFVKRSKLNASQWKKLVASGGIVSENGDEWYPSEQYRKGMAGTGSLNVRNDLNTKEDFEAIRDFLRPVMVSIQNSKRVLFDGPGFQNSPAWCIHPLVVEHLTIKNITVRNPWYSQNGDGLDIESCKNVLVENCNFDVGDDAICVKSGKDEDGRRRGIPCENIIIKNNVVYHGHGGVVVGSEMSGGVKNMHVSNCTFIGTDVGLRFKSTRGRGGVVENVFVSDIKMMDIPTIGISFNMYYGGLSVSEALEEGQMKGSTELFPIDEKTPQFKKIKISGITLKGAQQAIFLQGLPEMNLESVELENMILEAKSGLTAFDVNGLKISNISLTTDDNRALKLFNCKNVEVEDIDYNFNSPEAILIEGAESENISILSPINELERFTRIGNEVLKDSVKF